MCCVRIEDHGLLADFYFAVLEAAARLVHVQDSTGSGLLCVDKPARATPAMAIPSVGIATTQTAGRAMLDHAPFGQTGARLVRVGRVERALGHGDVVAPVPGGVSWKDVGWIRIDMSTFIEPAPGKLRRRAAGAARPDAL